MKEAMVAFIAILIGSVISVLVIIGLIRFTTPVLENYGGAYKSCAINGQSHTENYVAH